MAIVTVGIDLAMNAFAVHGVDETGKPALMRPEVPRAKLLELIANVPPGLIDRKACSGAHHWAKESVQFGHAVRLMAPERARSHATKWPASRPVAPGERAGVALNGSRPS